MITKNLSYELTRFEIPDSRPAGRYEPVICPHCGMRDIGADGYEHTTKCLNCGMLYFIRRRNDN